MRAREQPSATVRTIAKGQLLQMAEYHSLDPLELERFLERRRANPSFPLELSLAENLIEILRRANDFVPSQAGSILLDNPIQKRPNRRANSLTFIAAFGEKAQGLVGQTIPAAEGIAGRVYLSGEAYTTSNAQADESFYRAVDRETQYTTRSLVAIPIRIEQEVCGVIELINRLAEAEYSQQDLNLLEIFAGYISISIQNVLDGRQAQEIAKRDNLTGLFNDRYLHIALSQAIERARCENEDLAVLFLDLDFFKRVNDTHGHLAGSQVLREVGQLLLHKKVPPLSITARYGGDEFVLVLPDRHLPEAADFAEEIRMEINQTVFCDEEGEIQREPLHLTGLTCSIGIATLNRHITEDRSIDETRSTLLRLADAAMYVAKETGRNRTVLAGDPVRPRTTVLTPPRGERY